MKSFKIKKFFGKDTSRKKLVRRLACNLCNIKFSGKGENNMHKKMNCGFITEFLRMLSSAFSADFFIKKFLKNLRGSGKDEKVELIDFDGFFSNWCK